MQQQIQGKRDITKQAGCWWYTLELNLSLKQVALPPTTHHREGMSLAIGKPPFALTRLSQNVWEINISSGLGVGECFAELLGGR